nr:neutral ceramidase [Quercus suber]
MTISKLLRIAEFTTMPGRRLREAVKETLIGNGNGEFNNNTEGASTLYGPHTLSACIQEFKKLAEAMAKGEKIMKGPSPPDLFKAQLSLLPDHSGDSPPPGTNFGDMKQDIIVPKNGTFTKGDKASATFNLECKPKI